MSVAAVNTNLFPFTIDRTSMGLVSLWVSVIPKDSPSWTSIECEIKSATDVEFKAYMEWDTDEHYTHATRIRPELLAPYIEHRKQQIVNAVFKAEEAERERLRVENRKREIFNQLFRESE